MQTIDVYNSSNTQNASNVKDALETYATDYFSSVTVTDNIVSCYVDGTLWLTITIPSGTAYLAFECVGKTANCVFNTNGNLNPKIANLHIFDNAIVFEPNVNSTIVQQQSIVLIKNKDGAVTLLGANVSYSSTVVRVGVGSVNASGFYSFAAMSVGNDVMVYTGYRQYVIGGKAFGVPISTGDSSTENVLQSVVSVFSDQSVPHQIIVDGESWYAIAYDSIYIKSN